MKTYLREKVYRAILALMLIGCMSVFMVWVWNGNGLRLPLSIFQSTRNSVLTAAVIGNAALLVYWVYLRSFMERNPLYPIQKIRLKFRIAAIGLVFFGSAISFIVGVFFSNIVQNIEVALKWASDPMRNENFAIAVVGATTVIVGTLFFFLRLHCRAFYGVFEAGTGVIIVVEKIRNTNLSLPFDGSVYVTILTAGVYLIVRGFDNVHQYLTGRASDGLVSFINEWTNPREIYAREFAAVKEHELNK